MIAVILKGPAAGVRGIDVGSLTAPVEPSGEPVIYMGINPLCRTDDQVYRKKPVVNGQVALNF